MKVKLLAVILKPISTKTVLVRFHEIESLYQAKMYTKRKNVPFFSRDIWCYNFANTDRKIYSSTTLERYGPLLSNEPSLVIIRARGIYPLPILFLHLLWVYWSDTSKKIQEKCWVTVVMYSLFAPPCAEITYGRNGNVATSSPYSLHVVNKLDLAQ